MTNSLSFVPMKTPGQRGAFGDWLRAERIKRYDTQKAALAAFERLAGLKISESEYAQWESGSRVPKAENPKVHRLYEFFGSSPEEVVETPVESTDSALVAALAAQTEAINALVARLDRLVGSTDEGFRNLSDILGEVLGSTLGRTQDASNAGAPQRN